MYNVVVLLLEESHLNEMPLLNYTQKACMKTKKNQIKMLSLVHTEGKRKRKQKCSLMFVVFSLLVYCSLISFVCASASVLCDLAFSLELYFG